MSLVHRTIYQKEEDIAVKLPFLPAIQGYHPNGEFPLLEDPKVTLKAAIIGMFVLRPGVGQSVEGPLFESDKDVSDSLTRLYDEQCDWVYNLDGIDGGWIIANLNAVDAYRLGLQYALSDAVMVGSNTVCAEGVTQGDRLGYLWQPYGPFSWPSVSKIDKEVLPKVMEQRKYWQDLSILSQNRKYPAQIVITNSGKQHEGSPDFLSARVFHDYHPNTDEPIEAYILTTTIGAKRIKERCHHYHLQDRIDSMLIILPSLPNQPERMDLTSLPSLLYQKYDLRIINHDGGQKVLLDFARQGILTQMNLTFGRQINLQQVLEQLSPGIVDESLRMLCLQEVSQRIHYFFSSKSTESSRIVHGIPPALPLVYAIEDDAKEVIIGTFNCKHGFNFYEE